MTCAFKGRCRLGWVGILLLFMAPFWGLVGADNELTTLTNGAFSHTGPSYRQDFCPRYRDLVNKNRDNMDVRNALSGTEIHVFVFSEKYFQYNEATGIEDDAGYPGIHAQILDYMAERGNFTWRNSFGVWSTDEFGTDRGWTEFLQWGVERYDVLVGPFSPSTRRMNMGVSFVEGHIDGSMIMIRNVIPEEPTVNYFNFVKPFEVQVWLVIVAVVVFSAVTYQFLEHIGANNDLGEKSLRKQIMENLYMSFINITGNYSYVPTTLGGRVFGFFFAFWAMLITAAYTANLASILVVTNLPAPKIKDFQSAIDQGLRICSQKGTNMNEYIVENYPDSIPYLVPVDTKDIYNALHRGDCELMVDSRQNFKLKQLQEEFNPKCTLEWQGRQIQPISDGFATKLDPGIKCTDLVNEVFSYYMKEMKENGFLEEKWKEHSNFYARPGQCETAPGEGLRRLGEDKQPRQQSSSLRYLEASGTEGEGEGGSGADSEVPTSSLTLEDMAGTMLFQILGSLIAIGVALISGCDSKTKQKRNERRSRNRSSSAPVDLSSTKFSPTHPEEDSSAFYVSLQNQLRAISRQLEGVDDLSIQLEELKESVSKLREAFEMQNKGGAPDPIG